MKRKAAYIMNNIEIANETIKITLEKKYLKDGNEICLPDRDYAAVEVYSPQRGDELLKKDISEYFTDKECVYTVVNMDSFQAAHNYENAFVMNFANAHHAGGGFRLGANAQEEALCRCSTLYRSITSSAASEMYKYNNTRLSSVESDYMLYSPEVCVFRDEKCELLEVPFTASVITVPAPNRRGAALLASGKKIDETMIRRIKIMLMIAAEKGHRDLVLGAWGCGAFGNSPAKVAQLFYDVLIVNSFGKMFENVSFAVYGKTEGKNFREFEKVFKK